MGCRCRRRVPVSLIGTSLTEHPVNAAIDLAAVDTWLRALTHSLFLKALWYTVGSQELHQRRHRPDRYHHHGTQLDRHAVFEVLQVTGKIRTDLLDLDVELFDLAT